MSRSSRHAIRDPRVTLLDYPGLLAAALAAGAVPALAQQPYPVKPIRLIQDRQDYRHARRVERCCKSGKISAEMNADQRR